MLNFDVNKTIIMKDSISNKTADDIVNEIISDASWGREIDGKWVLETSEPSVHRPNAELISYVEYLEQNVDDKKQRNQLTGSFTMEGQPGEKFAEHAGVLRKGLRNADGTDVRVIHAFFEVMIYLKRIGRSFTLVFRTFGEDLAEVAEELNAFCEGRHPHNPGMRFDGSDGEPDYRLPRDDKTRFGTFHRSDDSMSLIMGTLEQPGEGKYKNCEDSSHHFYDGWPDVDITTGAMQVMTRLEEMTARPGTLGLRDYFQHWKSHGRSSKGGKVFFVDRHLRTNTHSVFFDDNIRFADSFIIHPLNRDHPTRQLWSVPLLRTHMCRAEPLEAIPDPMYFIRQLMRLEDGFQRSLESQKRLRRVCHNIRAKNRTIKNFKLETQDIRGRVSNVKSYDPWDTLRRTDSDCTMSELRKLEPPDELYMPNRYTTIMSLVAEDDALLVRRPHAESSFHNLFTSEDLDVPLLQDGTKLNSVQREGPTAVNDEHEQSKPIHEYSSRRRAAGGRTQLIGPVDDSISAKA